MNKLKMLSAALLLSLGAAAALAQVYPVPTVQTVGTADLFNDVVGGVGSVPSKYATAAQIAGVPGYVNGGAVSTTSYTYTFGNSVTNLFVQPAGTAASITLTTAASPSDGQRECFLSTQTTTSLTFTANTGQTVVNGPTAGVANTPICMTYSLATATWYRSP